MAPILATSKDGKRKFQSQPRLAIGKSGRLRLKRAGAEVSFLVCEGEGETFEELQRASVGTDDVGLKRISAGTAGDPCGVTVRFHDLRIRGIGLPATAAPIKRKPSGTPWGIVGLVVVMASGAGGWSWYRRRGYAPVVWVFSTRGSRTPLLRPHNDRFIRG